MKISLPRFFRLLPVLCLLPAAAHAQSAATLPLKLFESAQRWVFLPGLEFAPGGMGSFRIDSDGGRPAGVLAYDFGAGGTYVGALARLEIPGGFSELRFRVKGERPVSVCIRYLDSSSQTHQTPLRYADAGEWQLFRIDLTRRAPMTYHGAKDGVLHYPLTALTLMVEGKGGGREAPGEVRFADFVLHK